MVDIFPLQYMYVEIFDEKSTFMESKRFLPKSDQVSLKERSVFLMRSVVVTKIKPIFTK